MQNNGGPTFTRWLYAGSPTIDAGNPAGCTDHLAAPLVIDQRGYTRPLDGNSDGNPVCDIGAYEADPNNLPPPPPESLWYVAPSGSDSNNCHTPATACQTINAAIGKAASGDTISVSTGVYRSGTGAEVVLIGKNIILSGGWDSPFTSQLGRSIIDGQSQRRGVTLSQQITVQMDRWNIQYGVSEAADGGGIYIPYRANLVLNNSILIANRAGNIDPNEGPYQNGGGIGMGNYGNLVASNCLFVDNTANWSGGGIFSGGSALTLNNSTVSGNIAQRAGGGIASGDGGQIEINHSLVFNNAAASPYGGQGGGINSFNSALTLSHSTVISNTATAEGGGINGSTMTIEKSGIYQNQAGADGGGISSWYWMTVRDSSISYNATTGGSGGGICIRENLTLVNTTIASNEAHEPTIFQANGGGIFRAGGSIQASNVTIVRNYADDAGGGIYNQGSVAMRNTLLANNQASTGPDCTGTIDSAGYNLLGSTSACTLEAAAGDLANLDPKLDRVFGWPLTLALMADSPAIDAGNPAGCTDHQGNPITFDQIGTSRPLDGDGNGSVICDIGAFEYDLSHPPRWNFLPFIRK